MVGEILFPIVSIYIKEAENLFRSATFISSSKNCQPIKTQSRFIFLFVIYYFLTDF